MSQTHTDIFKSKVLGQPSGLFVLFFTEMWERFSFYGMRVLLINFLTMAIVGANPGWHWSVENAGALFGTYAMLLYITPIAGGIFADKIAGYRLSVVIGAAIMALGHISMAFETQTSLYVGLGLLVIGTGFFKPNITSIISEMYKDLPEKKDGAYTIFYMGVNAGAFFGMMLCGYLAERIGWSWGFGLASIFMILGTLQFWWAKPLFGKLGDRPDKNAVAKKVESKVTAVENEDKENPFTLFDKILIVISVIVGVGYAINDPLSKIAGIDLFSALATKNLEGQYVGIIIGLVVFLVLVISRITRYAKVTRDRMIALIIFLFFTIFFWMSFEQGASSLIIFARDSVNRVLTGNAAIIYNIVNSLLTVVPLGIISYVVFKLVKETHAKALKSNIVLIFIFVIIWGVAGWMLNRDWSTTAYNVAYNVVEVPAADENTEATYIPITEDFVLPEDAKVIEKHVEIADVAELKEGQAINIITKNNEKTEYAYLNDESLQVARERGKELALDNGVVPAKVVAIQENQVEITTSWFSILNSFFIIALASFFSKWWDSKYNPSANVKYGLGLIIMAVGFGLLALGAHGAVDGVKVSMVWLILAYLFHTMGELCLSPVGLSYVSKLVPARMIAFMFGMYYLAIAIGNKIAAVLGGQIENITEQYSLSTFFLIFTIVPIVAGVIVIALNPVMKKLMHGVR